MKMALNDNNWKMAPGMVQCSIRQTQFKSQHIRGNGATSTPKLHVKFHSD